VLSLDPPDLFAALSALIELLGYTEIEEGFDHVPAFAIVCENS
jgi:hypothetical protein